MAFNRSNNSMPSSPIVAPADPSVEGATSGMNAAQCNPGIGIASAEIDPKDSDWSPNARDPVAGQNIGWGGDSAESGQETSDIPFLKVVDYDAADFNDTFAFVQATAAVSTKGATVATGYILASNLERNTAVGEWIWAKTAVV